MQGFGGIIARDGGRSPARRNLRISRFARNDKGLQRRCDSNRVPGNDKF